MIHPNCAFSKLYYSLIYIFCFVSPALSMYEVSFNIHYLSVANQNIPEEDEPKDDRIQHIIHNYENYFEIFLATFIIMNFITPFQNEHGIYIKEFIPIAVNYIFSIDGLWLDLISTIAGLCDNTNRHLLFFCRTPRLVIWIKMNLNYYS